MSLIKGASVYLTTNIIKALIPFLILPILTRYLSTEEYGQVAIFQTFLALISSVVGLNTVGAASRKFYDDVDDQVLRRFNGSCVQLLLLSSSLFFFGVNLFKDELKGFLQIPLSWIMTAVFINSLCYITSLRLGQWQVRKKAKQYGYLAVSESTVNMGFSLLLLVVFKLGADSRVIAQLLACFISFIISLYLLYKDNLISIFVWNKSYIKEALAFGVPLLPHTFGLFLIAMTGRFVINNYLGLSEAGIYMVAVQLSTSMSIVFDAINKAYIPWLFERLKHAGNQEKRRIVRNTYVYFIAILIIVTFAFVLGPFIITLIAGEKYKSAGDVIGWLCLGQAFGGMYLMVTNYNFYAKKTKNLAIVTIATGIINVPLLLIFVNKFGIVGAGISFAIAKFLQFSMTWFLANRAVYMPWNLLKS